MQNISDTARWVAYYRALESEQPHPCFRDPYARLLVGDNEKELLKMIHGIKSLGWTIIVRTCVFDEFISHAINQAGVDTVLNLACGLDTRPYRLSLPEELHWIEVDLPGILTYKEEKLANERPRCLLERVKLDLTDIPARNGLFARISSEARQVFILSEGFLVYLTTEQVSSLATSLHAYPNFRWWSTELISPQALQLFGKILSNKFASANIHFHFAPAEGERFFQRYGWNITTKRSTIEEAARLKLNTSSHWSPLFNLLSLFSKNRAILENMTTFLLMERTRQSDKL